MTQPGQQVYLHKTCRACRGRLEEILNLGNLRLNAFPATRFEIDQLPLVPLVLTACTECGLVQLDRTVPQDWLYRQYWYRSAVNESMVAELADVVTEATQVVPLHQGDRVLDIGANDGTLLKHYPRQVFRIAVEPAVNLQDELQAHAEYVVNDYFPAAEVAEEFQGTIKIITAIACAYDAEDPTRFFQVIHDLLAPNGIAVIQFQDFGQQIVSRAFDNVCHEHLEYYTLWSLLHICRQVGLSPVRCSPRLINGGSLRVILRRMEDMTNDRAEQNVGTQLVYEGQLGLDTPTLRNLRWGGLHRFKAQVEEAKRQIQAVLQQAVDENRIVDLYGASTKGNILLQVLGIGSELARQTIDRSPQKWGRHTITGVPIVSEEQAKIEPADLWLTPIWQFRESVLRRERWYLEQGGTICFPLPHVDVVKESWGWGHDHT